MRAVEVRRGEEGEGDLVGGVLEAADDDGAVPLGVVGEAGGDEGPAEGVEHRLLLRRLLPVLRVHPPHRPQDRRLLQPTLPLIPEG